MAFPSSDDCLQDSHEDSRYRRVEVITGRRRRRDWTAAEKAEIVAASAVAGASVSEVARRYGVNRALLSAWRRQAGLTRAGRSRGGGAGIDFIPIAVDGTGDGAPGVMSGTGDGGVRGLEGRPVSGPAVSGMVFPSCSGARGRIEVVVGTVTVRVPLPVDEDALRAVLAAVRATA